RRVVMEFGAEPPPVPAWPRMLGGRQVGTALELLVVGWDEDLARRAEALHPRRVEVLRLSLEDAFIDYTRGARRPLPIFATETPDVEGDAA
ncbi:MAG: hypothetical protein HYU66_07865, partial [Armatimonadetes bacterium]|nr:hypothetical protein [Armatimonadota bacterium]